MRYSRIIAAIVFSSALIFILCTSVFASPALEDTLYCYYGVGYYAPMNSNVGKWQDFDPTVNDSSSVFAFNGIPDVLIDGNYEYSFQRFAFMMAPDNIELSFENGYIYTFNFTIKSTKNSDPSQTHFEFGVSEEGFTNALSLGNVVFNYDIRGTTTVTYYVTVTIYVDDTFPANSVPHPDDAYVYLELRTEWSDTFTLTASNLTMKKAVGEGAYYQASLDAIENLPNTEYDFTLNKMPDAEGVVEVIKGDADAITNELNLQLTDALGVFTGISGEEPLIYMPKMKIPILNLDLADYTEGYISQDGYFKPLAMIQDMDKSGQAMAGIELARKFLQLTFVFAFATIGIEKMLKIEWWF